MYLVVMVGKSGKQVVREWCPPTTGPATSLDLVAFSKGSWGGESMQCGQNRTSRGRTKSGLDGSGRDTDGHGDVICPTPNPAKEAAKPKAGMARLHGMARSCHHRSWGWGRVQPYGFMELQGLCRNHHKFFRTTRSKRMIHLLEPTGLTGGQRPASTKRGTEQTDTQRHIQNKAFCAALQCTYEVRYCLCLGGVHGEWCAVPWPRRGGGAGPVLVCDTPHPPPPEF